MGGLSPGAMFAGYVVEDVLARGGMGVVYRAKELRPERTVALKIVAPELAAEADFRLRFLRESQLAAEIEHPHVVPVLRVGEEEGRLFIAMRFVRGTDLAAMIASEGRLSPVRIARIVDQVADALEIAHERGMVHRDVKPANVLIERHRRGEHAYLTDFGLTKHLGSTSGVTSTGVVVGTVDYMAPEQLEGAPLDARADVYSLGCVLFEGLTGRVPYPKEGRAARMYAHLNAPAPSVSEVAPDVPREFDGVVRRALAKNPDDRYPSACDLGQAALAAAEGRSLSPPTGRSLATARVAPDEATSDGGTARTHVVRPSRRPHRPRSILAAGAGLCIAAVLAVVVLISPSEASPSSLAKSWLSAYNKGDDRAATALWKAPATVETAFPSRTYSLGTADALRTWWMGRGCHLRLTAPVAVAGNLAVLRVYADGQRSRAAGKACTSVGTSYEYHLTTSAGHIVKLVSFLAPASVAEKWLKAYDRGDDVLAATLWTVPSSWQSAYSPYPANFATTDAVRNWSSGNGCHLKIVAPVTVSGSVVTLRLYVDAPRNAIRCTSIGQSFVDELTVRAGHIVKLVSGRA